jgi:hypothetical protein
MIIRDAHPKFVGGILEVLEGKGDIVGLGGATIDKLDEGVAMFLIFDTYAWYYRPDMFPVCRYVFEIPAFEVVPLFISSLKLDRIPYFRYRIQNSLAMLFCAVHRNVNLISSLEVRLGTIK